MAERKVVDRERLELDYRTGLHTFKEMSVTHGISGPRIKQIADRAGWKRDLGARIRQTAAAKLATLPSPEKLETEAEIVERGSNNIVNIVLEHQSDGGRMRRLAMTMLEELELSTRAPMLLQDLQAVLAQHAAGDEIPHAVLNRVDLALHQAMTLDSRAGTLKSLAETLTKVVAIEREAHAVDSPTPPPPDPAAFTFPDPAALKAKFDAIVERHRQQGVNVDVTPKFWANRQQPAAGG